MTEDTNQTDKAFSERPNRQPFPVRFPEVRQMATRWIEGQISPQETLKEITDLSEKPFPHRQTGTPSATDYRRAVDWFRELMSLEHAVLVCMESGAENRSERLSELKEMMSVGTRGDEIREYRSWQGQIEEYAAEWQQGKLDGTELIILMSSFIDAALASSAVFGMTGNDRRMLHMATLADGIQAVSLQMAAQYADLFGLKSESDRTAVLRQVVSPQERNRHR
ncbi:MAG: hypothetical protein KDA96_16080 [Planctomycetaceae bacterium]|nr:hypothetical protein [Planctomycetaceae bacterium]